MNGYIEVETAHNQKLLINTMYISELIDNDAGQTIIVLNNGSQYTLTNTYSDIKYKLFDIGRPMTL